MVFVSAVAMGSMPERKLPESLQDVENLMAASTTTTWIQEAGCERIASYFGRRAKVNA